MTLAKSVLPLKISFPKYEMKLKEWVITSSDSNISLNVVGSYQGDLGDTHQLCVYFNIRCGGGESNLCSNTDMIGMMLSG